MKVVRRSIRWLNRHSWMWFILAYVISEQILVFLWPWRGWSLRVMGGLLLIGLIWGVGYIDGTARRKGNRKHESRLQ